MKTEEILGIEESGENRINLVRDRLFWQAWNRSAFLFVTYLRKYRVHKRFVQKVSQEVAWLGFPKTALADIEKVAESKGWVFERKNDDHIIISGVPAANGYEKWWAGIVKPADSGAASAKIAKAAAPSKQSQLLPAYKAAYDLCLNVHRATAKMPKEFRYELGARVRGYATDIAESLHLMCGVADARSAAERDTIADCAKTIHRLRIDIRILNDLRQIGINQWGYLNQQIEGLLECLRAEFRKANVRFAGASQNQSSGALPPAEIAGEHLKSYENFSFKEAFS
jgi:hypothetical protein